MSNEIKVTKTAGGIYTIVIYKNGEMHERVIDDMRQVIRVLSDMVEVI